MRLPNSNALFNSLGVVFALIGGFSLLSVLYAYYLAHVFLAGAAAYAAMDFLIAYAFFSREQWLLWALALNLSAYTLLVLYVGLLRPDASLAMRLFGFVLNAAVFFVVYRERAELKPSHLAWTTGVPFFLVWAYGISYTVFRSFY